MMFWVVHLALVTLRLMMLLVECRWFSWWTCSSPVILRDGPIRFTLPSSPRGLITRPYEYISFRDCLGLKDAKFGRLPVYKAHPARRGLAHDNAGTEGEAKVGVEDEGPAAIQSPIGKVTVAFDGGF